MGSLFDSTHNFGSSNTSHLTNPSISFNLILQGNPQGNNPLTRPVSNGYPGMHPFRRQADLQSTAVNIFSYLAVPLHQLKLIK